MLSILHEMDKVDFTIKISFSRSGHTKNIIVKFDKSNVRMYFL